MGFMFTRVQIQLLDKKLYTKLRESGRRATIPVQSTVDRNPTVSPVTNDFDQCQSEAE